MVQRVSLQDDFQELAQLLNDSFGTVAVDFGLTIENCPTNSAFITSEELKSQLTENREFYAFHNEIAFIGFIAIERSLREAGTYYIEKVAVHPNFRHEGIGEKLMLYAESRIEKLGGSRISIALIDSNVQLKKWYLKQGFTITETKIYEHLPFDVCFMEKYLKYKSQFCEVHYNQDLNVVFVKWEKFCKGNDYREPLLYAIEIMKKHDNCHYVADTRDGFENEEEDTAWVFNEFAPKADEAGCEYIFFIISPDNNLKKELEGQSVALKKYFKVIACFDLAEVEEVLKDAHKNKI